MRSWMWAEQLELMLNPQGYRVGAGVGGGVGPEPPRAGSVTITGRRNLSIGSVVLAVLVGPCVQLTVLRLHAVKRLNTSLYSVTPHVTRMSNPAISRSSRLIKITDTGAS